MHQVVTQHMNVSIKYQSFKAELNAGWNTPSISFQLSLKPLAWGGHITIHVELSTATCHTCSGHVPSMSLSIQRNRCLHMLRLPNLPTCHFWSHTASQSVLLQAAVEYQSVSRGLKKHESQHAGEYAGATWHANTAEHGRGLHVRCYQWGLPISMMVTIQMDQWYSLTWAHIKRGTNQSAG